MGKRSWVLENKDGDYVATMVLWLLMILCRWESGELACHNGLGGRAFGRIYSGLKTTLNLKPFGLIVIESSTL